MPPLIRLIPAAVAAAALLAACTSTGSTGSSASGTPSRSAAPSASRAGTFPVTIDTPAGPITVSKQPQRIVSLSPSATETLFAIGAGPVIVAADEYSNFPAEAPAKKGLSGFQPNVEAVAAFKPDLVVVSNDANGIVAGMKKLGVPTLVSPAPTTIEAGFDTMAALGLATGRLDETAATVARLRAEVAAALAKAPKGDRLRIYHELDPSLFSASSSSFIGDVYRALGATNIADAADKDKTGYPKLTAEAIIAADPQVIVITDQTSATVENVAKRPGWAGVSAVKNGAIVSVNADIASRWGPRLPQLITVLAGALESAKVKS
jgi:iron complex transport system substrate-binding protein